MPIRVAIVEDNQEAADTLSDRLNRYSQEYGVNFQIQHFANALIFLDHYTAAYDLVFMDIQMPMMNGMDASKRLRQLDPEVALVFVTTLTQYAIQGYEVAAVDYIVKPFQYFDFALKMPRILKRIPQREKASIKVATDLGTVRLAIDDIQYIEVQDHHLVYHTRDGDYTQYSSLSKIEPKLTEHGFVRCNNCYLVNLQFVQGISGLMATVGGEQLKISQPRRKAFVEAFADYRKQK